MPRPRSRDEYRREMAEAFAGILEEKGLEWKKGWTGTGAGAPRNGITGAFYHGSNAFWLSLAAMRKGYEDPRWVTMVQIMDRDARYHPDGKWHLKAGSKAVYVEYWYPFDLKENRAVTWDLYKERLENGRKQEDFRLCTRYTAVFNACEVEGMPELAVPEGGTVGMDELVRRVSDGLGVPILTDGGDMAFYSPHQDKIHLPAPGSFEDEYAFNSTALHELSHSTGHPARLNRPQTGMFGTAGYAYEELVAEMSSCFMGSGLKTKADRRHLDNHKAYVRSWISAVREKPETLIRAIRDAQGAANYMDWKAGLMTDLEYEACRDKTFETGRGDRERCGSR